MTLDRFIQFAKTALATFLQLAEVFETPIRTWASTLPKWATGGIFNRVTFLALDAIGFGWIGDMSLFTMLFSSTAITVLIIIAMVKWITDIVT